MNRAGIAALVAISAGCGYHVSGHSDLMPKTMKIIAIPAFANPNATTRQKLPIVLTSEVTREFISRTRYTVVADPEQADAVLSGAVLNYVSYPTVLDPITNRATGVQVLVTVQVSLTDRHTGKILWSRPNVEFRERYEIASDPQAYFDESDTAMQRLARDVARGIVSAVLQAF
jgi:hypothetical protein